MKSGRERPLLALIANRMNDIKLKYIIGLQAHIR